MVGELTDEHRQLAYSACINSIHPLSRAICNYLGRLEPLPVDAYEEVPGKGITTIISGHQIRVGNSNLVLGFHAQTNTATKVHLLIDDEYTGFFCFGHQYREGLGSVSALSSIYDLFLLSGDQDHEKRRLLKYFKAAGHMRFEQSPQQKLDFIKSLQQDGKKVMMLGDGLNDSGALKQSDIGIAVTDNVNNFSPGSDAILDGKSFHKLPAFLRFSKDTVNIIHFSFLISLAYNFIGLSYAVTGRLSPLIAAVLMPLSTATIISFTTLATRFAARKRRLI